MGKPYSGAMHFTRSKAQYNPFLEEEVLSAIRRQAYSDLEKIPEMRDLMLYAQTSMAERGRIADSLNVLPLSDLRKLFNDYINESFDAYLHQFFGRLEKGIMRLIRSTLSARLEVMEETVTDLKQSMLMAAIHPYAWVEHEIVKNAIDFISTQPGKRSGVHDIYVYLAQKVGVPIPGAGLSDKYHYLVRVLRKVPIIKEWNDFLFEIENVEVKEESDLFVSSDEYGNSVLLSSLSRMAEGETGD